MQSGEWRVEWSVESAEWRKESRLKWRLKSEELRVDN